MNKYRKGDEEQKDNMMNLSSSYESLTKPIESYTNKNYGNATRYK